jgi:hypothetical protein
MLSNNLTEHEKITTQDQDTADTSIKKVVTTVLQTLQVLTNARIVMDRHKKGMDRVLTHTSSAPRSIMLPCILFSSKRLIITS